MPEKYSQSDRKWATNALRASEWSADSLPYTPDFEKLFEEFNSTQLVNWTRPDFWQLLLTVRKRGLGRQPRKRAASPELTLKQLARLRELMPDKRGEVDRLPYTSRFDSIYTDFKKFFSGPVTKREVWLACLRIVKSRVRPKAKPFLDKAVLRLRTAINSFNTIGHDDRPDESLISLHHACEMLLKASLIQQQLPEIDDRTGHYRSFKDSLRSALHDPEANFVSHADATLLRAIDASRGDAYHGLLETDETELYLLVNTGVEVFGRMLEEVFGLQLHEYLESRVLPVSTIPLATPMVLLDRKGDQVRSLLNAGERERAKAAIRSLAILEKAIGNDEDAQLTDDEARAKLREFESAEHISECFPKVAAISISSAGTGAVIHLSVRGKKNIQADAVSPDTGTSIVGVRELRPEDSHPHRTMDLVQRTGVSRNKLLGVIAELDLKNDPACCYLHGPPGSQKTPGYSERAVQRIRQFVESYDGEVGELYAKHFAKSSRRKKG